MNLLDIPADVFTASILNRVSLDDVTAMIMSGPRMATYVRDAFRALQLAPLLLPDFPNSRIVIAALNLSNIVGGALVGSLPQDLHRVFVHYILTNTGIEEEEEVKKKNKNKYPPSCQTAASLFLRYATTVGVCVSSTGIAKRMHITWEELKLCDVPFKRWMDELYGPILREVNPIWAGALIYSLFKTAARRGRTVGPSNVARVIRGYSERNESSLIPTLEFASAFIIHSPRTTTSAAYYSGLERGKIVAELTTHWGGLVSAQLLSSSWALSSQDTIDIGIDSDDDYEVARLALEVYPYASFHIFGNILQHLSVAVVSNVLRMMRVKFGLEPRALAAYTCLASQNWNSRNRSILYDNLNSLPSSYCEKLRKNLGEFTNRNESSA